MVTTFFQVLLPLKLEEEDHQLEGAGGGAPLKLEEEDHQLEGAEEDEEEEEKVLQGLLLCSMCTIEHKLGYVIISYVFVSPSMIWT
jgi:hypothetical protein